MPEDSDSTVDPLLNPEGGETPESEPEDKRQPSEGSIQDRARQHIKNEVSRIRQGGRRVPRPPVPRPSPGASGVGGRASGAASRAEGRAAQVAAKAGQATAQALRAAAKVGLQLLTKTPVGWIIIIILLVIIIIGAIFAIYGLGRDTGGGPPITPTSAQHVKQATLLSALSGDSIAKNEIVLEVVEAEKERYGRIKANADQLSPEFSEAIAAKQTEFGSRLDELVLEQDSSRRRELKNALETEMLAFENTLPFGKWIAKLAEERVGQPNVSFCTVTGAGANVACASFVSTVLYLAGVPNAIVPLVDQIWHSPPLKTIVDRPSQKSASYYQENVGSLKAGDIIFWGDGACSPRGSVLFDHVGFYVGQDQAVDTSSSEKKVLKRSAESRGSCRVFNGAKRYGAD